MAEGDCPAVDVDAVVVGAEQVRRMARDRRERLVDLDALYVADRLARALEGHRARARGRAGEVRVVVGDVTLRDDRREWLDAPPLRPLLARDDDARRAVVHAGRIAGSRRSLGIEDRLQRSEL